MQDNECVEGASLDELLIGNFTGNFIESVDATELNRLTKREHFKEVLESSTSLKKRMRAARKLKMLAKNNRQKVAASKSIKTLKSLQEAIRYTIDMIRRIKKLDSKHGLYAEKLFCETQFNSMKQLMKFREDFKISKNTLSKLMLEKVENP